MKEEASKFRQRKLRWLYEELFNTKLYSDKYYRIMLDIENLEKQLGLKEGE